MNVALIGSVSSSWYALDSLIKGGVEITGVLGVDESQAAKISDYRSLSARAGGAGVAFCPFVKVSEPAVAAFLEAHQPDLLFVIGLSQLVPKPLIELAKSGAVGFHPTMLPEGRGRAPVAWTILSGARAAVNLFFLVDEADAGDIIVQREVPVLPNDYSEDLIHRTNLVLAEVIAELAPRIRSGDLPRRPQDHAKATYYAKRTAADGAIDWSATTDQVYRLIRAAGRPYPGAFARCDKHKLIVWRARPAKPGELEKIADRPRPGQILAVDEKEGILVGTADGGIWITEVESPKRQRIADLIATGRQLELLSSIKGNDR